MKRSLFKKLVKWRSRYKTIKKIERRHADEHQLKRHDDCKLEIDKAVNEMQDNNDKDT